MDAPATGASGDTASTDAAAPATAKPRRRAAGLSGMVLSELQAMAAELGISGTARMRKGQLIEAIKERQGGGTDGGRPAGQQAAGNAPAEETRPAEPAAPAEQRGGAAEPGRDEGRADGGQRRERRPDRQQGDRQQGDRQQGDRQQGDRQQGDRQQGDRQQGGRDRNRDDDDDFEGRGGGRRRRGRYRDRNRNRRGREGFAPGEAEPEISEDDVLVPVAGILDILDNYAFVRTSGYLPGPNDVYVSLAQVRKSGLRKGDAITGAVRQPREGERKEKFNALVRLDTVNGTDPEKARGRVEFNKLTPLYPQERLRLETEPNVLTTRVIDLVAPIGKGQRGLIVSPPKAGKTMVLQAI